MTNITTIINHFNEARTEEEFNQVIYECDIFNDYLSDINDEHSDELKHITNEIKEQATNIRMALLAGYKYSQNWKLSKKSVAKLI